MPDAANFADQVCRQFQLHQHCHLTVAILFDDVNAIVFFKEFDEMLA